MEFEKEIKPAKPERKFICLEEGCNASFTKRNKLTYHIRKHNDERPFICNESGCEKSYTNSSHLLRHKKVSHGNTNEKVECPICQGLFSNKWNLNKHIERFHNPLNNNAYSCTDCQLTFKKRDVLLEHSFIHTGVPPFSCDKCEFKFTTKKTYDKHQRNHKKYFCNCGKVFNRWTVLLAHRRESRCQKYQCNVCKEVFATRHNLTLHSQIHEENRETFYCRYENCSKHYFYRKNLNKHINVTHKGMKEQEALCTSCGNMLSSKEKLKMHIKKIHSEEKKVKKERKPRKDKGIPRLSVVEKLTGVSLQDDDEQEMLSEYDLHL